MAYPPALDLYTQLEKDYKSFITASQNVIHSYPLYKIGNSKGQSYNSDNNDLGASKTMIFNFQNNLNGYQTNIDNHIIELNRKIIKINKENDILTKEFNSLQNLNSGAEGELIEKRYLYNELYIQNIVLLLVLIVSVGIYFTNDINNVTDSKDKK